MNLDNQEAKDLAVKIAASSPCQKRKVGAVITDARGMILSSGHNHNPDGSDCECEKGTTKDTVVHAEVSAIRGLLNSGNPAIIYVTHLPCENCAKAIKDAGIVHTVIAEAFLKFDSGKLRYGLIPPSAMKSLAEVLTFGAKKYKPNNWQNVDSLDRYVDAMFRHIEAWREGEKMDKESGMPHLAHALTNLMFLNHLDDKMDFIGD